MAFIAMCWSISAIAAILFVYFFSNCRKQNIPEDDEDSDGLLDKDSDLEYGRNSEEFEEKDMK